MDILAEKLFERTLEEAKVEIRLSQEQKSQMKDTVVSHMKKSENAEYVRIQDLSRQRKQRFSFTHALSLIFKHMGSKQVSHFGVAGVFAILVVVFGTTGYVYTSPTVTRGDMLYPVKTVIENIGKKRAKTSIEKVRVYTNLSLKRLGEAKVLAENQSDDTSLSAMFERAVVYAQTDEDEHVEVIVEDSPENYLTETLEEMVKDTEVAIEATEDIVDTDELQDALNVVESTQSTQINGLETVANNVGLFADEVVVDSVALALSTTLEEQIEVTEAYDAVLVAVIEGVEPTVEIVTTGDTETSEGVQEDGAKEVETREELAELETVIEAFKEEMLASGITEVAKDKLFGRLNSRLEKVRTTLDSGQFGKARGLMKSTRAFMNGGKHFTKKHRFGDNAEAYDLFLKERKAAHVQLREEKKERHEEARALHRELRAAVKTGDEEEQEALKERLEEMKANREELKEKRHETMKKYTEKKRALFGSRAGVEGTEDGVEKKFDGKDWEAVLEDRREREKKFKRARLQTMFEEMKKNEREGEEYVEPEQGKKFKDKKAELFKKRKESRGTENIGGVPVATDSKPLDSPILVGVDEAVIGGVPVEQSGEVDTTSVEVPDTVGQDATVEFDQRQKRLDRVLDRKDKRDTVKRR